MKVAVILSVTPAASCSAKQSFNVLSRPKRNLRGNMGQDRLIHMSLLYIKHPYVKRIDIEKANDEFASKKVVLFPTNF